MRALAPPVAVGTTALVLLAGIGWLISATDDSPDANIGLGLLLLGSFVLTVVVWAGVDGLRTVRKGRPDREGLLVWLVSAAAFAVLLAAGTGVGVAVTGGADEGVPVGVLLGAPATGAFVAFPAAVSYGLVRSAAGAQARSRRAID